MEYGLFIPIANDGWITSTTSPTYLPTFELNRQIVHKAERLGFSFALSMAELRGYGGATEHWDYAPESFTLMAGLAAVTEKMALYASVAIPTIHPAIVARMAATIDSIAPGPFGVNIVAGWSKSEGTDVEALEFMRGQAALGTRSAGTSARLVARVPKAVNDGAVVGSPATVAEKLHEIAAVEGTAGIMLAFDDVLEGTERFGSEVMPLLA